MQVRTLVGELSSVDFGGLGSCRVHIFLRIADAPARDLHSAQRTQPTVGAAASFLSIAGVSDENSISYFQNLHQGLDILVATGLVVCLSNVLLPTMRA